MLDLNLEFGQMVISIRLTHQDLMQRLCPSVGELSHLGRFSACSHCDQALLSSSARMKQCSLAFFPRSVSEQQGSAEVDQILHQLAVVSGLVIPWTVQPVRTPKMTFFVEDRSALVSRYQYLPTSYVALVTRRLTLWLPSSVTGLR